MLLLFTWFIVAVVHGLLSTGVQVSMVMVVVIDQVSQL